MSPLPPVLALAGGVAELLRTARQADAARTYMASWPAECAAVRAYVADRLDNEVRAGLQVVVMRVARVDESLRRPT